MKVEERRRLSRKFNMLKPMYSRILKRNRNKVNITLLELVRLADYIESKGISVDTIDLEAIIDPKLTYNENKEIIDEVVRYGY